MGRKLKGVRYFTFTALKKFYKKTKDAHEKLRNKSVRFFSSTWGLMRFEDMNMNISYLCHQRTQSFRWFVLYREQCIACHRWLQLQWKRFEANVLPETNRDIRGGGLSQFDGKGEWPNFRKLGNLENRMMASNIKKARRYETRNLQIKIAYKKLQRVCMCLILEGNRSD